MAFGALRAKILINTTHWLSSVVTAKQNTIFKILYKCTAFIWERLTPSIVFRVMSGEDYSVSHNSIDVYRKSGRVGYYANDMVFGNDSSQRLNVKAMNDLTVRLYHGVAVFHGSDHIANLRECVVVNDYLANKREPNCSYEDCATYTYDKGVVILRKWRHHESIESGIMINGKFSYNYYHNMYENLIRLLVLSDINDLIPPDVPIIVDEEICTISSFRRVYEILSQSLHRGFLQIKRDEVFILSNLYSISAVNELVPCHLDVSKGLDSDYTFDKDLTLKMRESLLLYKDNGLFPKRFFITRKSAKHRHFNEQEVYEALEPFGFVRVAPEDYTIEQQIALFNQAEWVIGGSGAAFTNMLFCEKQCHAVVIEKNHPYLHPVFTAPICFNGASIIFFTTTTGEEELTAHGSFRVDINEFKRFIEVYIVPQIK